MLHYWWFWTSASAIVGSVVGVFAFAKRRKYRLWVMQQPKETQLDIIAKNAQLTSPTPSKIVSDTTSNLKSSSYIKSRLTSLPNSIDPRPTLSYSGDLKPNAWFETGPLKMWNQKASYPWASELMSQIVKWTIRIGLVTSMTIGLECLINKVLYYPLGVNIWIRGFAGFITGGAIATLASEGILGFWRTFLVSLLLGGGWMVGTYMQPNWGELASAHGVPIGMHIPAFDTAYNRKLSSEKDIREIGWKQALERNLAFEELKKKDPNFKLDALSDVDKILASVSQEELKERMKKHGVEISEKIDKMSFEERLKFHKKRRGDSMAGLDYEKWPWKYLTRKLPQWVVLNTHTITEILEHRNEYHPSENEDDLELLS